MSDDQSFVPERRDRPRAGTGSRSGRVRKRLKVEMLEERVLMATLEIPTSPTPTRLTYVSSPLLPTPNTLSIQVSNLAPPSRVYTFTDASDTITLGPGAISLGWRAIDAHT